ncbi:translocation/assembly module TamB domain-containing protein [Goodfellowiella coeruleoviolacea]|uniref:Oxidoreductase n=1 Tax=Goodfellowiella coeruleoviolacea TaxID=334858 RepID=A0AAE3GKI8_9PSEU|nr:hypothetical protein [Goodfellowiella coeruleoviolacea]MCP2168924.1 hypothetical protein [Goodfellowiella coeruleoviolacea]
MTEYVRPDVLTGVERRVCAAFARGERLNLNPAGRGVGRAGQATRADRQVRAGVLAGLLTGYYRIEPAGIPALRLAGAEITGELDLEGCRISPVVDLLGCVFEHGPNLRMADLVGLRLRGCRLPGLRARNLSVHSDLVLEAGFHSDGVVDLTDATVDGTLRLAGAVLRSNQDHALLGARLRISGSIQAIALRATGEVRLRGANIGGSVHLGGARLSNPGQDALEATGLVVTGNLFCDSDGGRFTAEGRVLLDGARIGGDAVFSGARLRASQRAERQVLVIPRGLADDSAALVADRIRVDGNVELDQGFTTTGGVRLPSARIGGHLRLSGAVLGHPDVIEEVAGQGGAAGRRVPVALHADGIEVGGDLEARGAVNGGLAGDGDRANALRTYGQVRLADGVVRGSASLSRVQLHAPGADVLFADRLRVGGTLFLRDARARGSVRMQNAAIGSTVDFTGARLTEPRLRPDGSVKPSLDVNAATIGKDLLCSFGFQATGGVRCRWAEVGKMASFNGARLGGSSTEIALNCYGLSADQLVLRFGEAAPQGRVLLTRAKVSSASDGAGLWTASGGVVVEDFVYGSIAAHPDDVDVRTRLGWLRRAQPDFTPGPYEQLAAVYRAGGDEERARQVLWEKQRRRYSELGVAGRSWGALQRWTVGYGYRPWLAIAWLGVFWLFGAVWLDAALGGHHQPMNDDDHPVWSPWVLSMDLLLPIIDLGQDGKWQFPGASLWVSNLLIAVGWVLASTAAAGLTRVLKRN